MSEDKILSSFILESDVDINAEIRIQPLVASMGFDSQVEFDMDSKRYRVVRTDDEILYKINGAPWIESEERNSFLEKMIKPVIEDMDLAKKLEELYKKSAENSSVEISIKAFFGEKGAKVFTNVLLREEEKLTSLKKYIESDTTICGLEEKDFISLIKEMSLQGILSDVTKEAMQNHILKKKQEKDQIQKKVELAAKNIEFLKKMDTKEKLILLYEDIVNKHYSGLEHMPPENIMNSILEEFGQYVNERISQKLPLETDRLDSIIARILLFPDASEKKHALNFIKNVFTGSSEFESDIVIRKGVLKYGIIHKDGRVESGQTIKQLLRKRGVTKRTDNVLLSCLFSRIPIVNLSFKVSKNLNNFLFGMENSNNQVQEKVTNEMQVQSEQIQNDNEEISTFGSLFQPEI